MRINTNNEFVRSLLQNVETESDVKRVVNSIVENTELDKKEVLAILNGDVAVNDAELLGDVVSAVHAVTPLTESDVEEIFYNAQELCDEAISALEEYVEEEEEYDDDEDYEDDDYDDDYEEDGVDAEDLLDIQEKVVSTFAKASSNLDSRISAIENEKNLTRFYNKVANLKNRFDRIKDMPQVANKMLFGKNLNLNQLVNEVVKNAKLSGVSPSTYLYGLESIVQFCETLSPIIKFAQVYAVPDEDDIEQLKDVVKFSMSMDKRDEQFLAQLGLGEDDMKRKFK